MLMAPGLQGVPVMGQLQVLPVNGKYSWGRGEKGVDEMGWKGELGES